MKEISERKYIKRIQKDYSIRFKIQIVEETEREKISRTVSKHKYIIQNDNTILNCLRKFDENSELNRNNIDSNIFANLLKLNCDVPLALNVLYFSFNCHSRKL